VTRFAQPTLVHLALALLAGLAAAGCYDSHLRGTDAGVLSDAPAGGLVWALVHPTDAPLGPGLFLLDEGRGVIVRRLPLPGAATSPHGLAWDGRSLWLSDVGDLARPTIYEISPDDGSVRSSFVGPATEGLAWDPATRMFWASTTSAITRLVRFDRSGEVFETRETSEATIQDLVSARGSLYYLVNDDLDRIVRLDLEGHRSVELARHVDPSPYSLGFDGESIASAAWGRIRRYDPSTGALSSDREFLVAGWITAIAFVR
jgi:hypothetical protein